MSMCDISPWNDPFAVTLTARRVTRTCADSGTRHFVGREQYAQNLRHFLNVLNKRVYGNAAQRGMKRLRVIPVFEQHQSGRYHLHLAIDRPPHVDEPTFTSMISETWHKTSLGYRNIKVVPHADSGWIGYILKRRSKNGPLTDAIDWASFHNPDCRVQTPFSHCLIDQKET